MTPIIGRGTDVHRLRDLIGDSHLVAIVGAAGCGKTRLAIELAHVLSPRFPDGVWFIDLGQVDDPTLVVDLTLAMLGVAVPAVGTPLRALASQMRGRQALVVLDNCEHVLPGVRELVETLVGDEADCTVVATSREPLSLPGELIYTLAPLRLPDSDRPDDESPAVALFRSRFRLAEPTVALTEEDLRTVAEICVGLDGLPLAIELAAARGRSYSIAEIAEQVMLDPSRLGRRARLFSPPAARLGDEIARSYGQMTEPEQRCTGPWRCSRDRSPLRPPPQSPMTRWADGPSISFRCSSTGPCSRRRGRTARAGRRPSASWRPYARTPVSC